jgi:hypothetical protein
MNAPVMLGIPTIPPPAPRGVGNLRGGGEVSGRRPASARRHPVAAQPWQCNHDDPRQAGSGGC